MNNQLITPDQISDIEKFEKRRKQLEELVTQAANIPTPKEFVKKKGEFDTVEFKYLHQQANKYHPRRSIRFHESHFDEKTLTFSFTVEVVDLETGESRLGTSIHPIIAYEGGSDRLKPPKTIRELMNNAKKAALTGAIRDAYAHFGIAADMYDMDFPLPVTDEQNERLENLLKDSYFNKHFSKEEVEKVISWVNSIRNKWKQCSQQTADGFLDKLQDQITKLKERSNDGTEQVLQRGV